MISQVCHRMQSLLRAKEFTANSFRSILIGCLVGITMCDVILYNQLQTRIKYGLFPWYIADVLIITIGLLEALTSPLCAWFGRWRLRTLTFLAMLVSVSSLGLFMLSPVQHGTGSQFCTTSSSIAPPTSYTGMTVSNALMLTVIIVIAIISVIFKAALWNNSIILFDQSEPAQLSLHYGILVGVRIMALYLVPKLLNDGMALWTQVLGVLVPILIHSFQFFRLPLPNPQEEKDSLHTIEPDTTVLGSFGRVLTSGLSVAQIFAMALLVAPLWGYLWHLSDIMKLLFYTVEPKVFQATQTELIYYQGMIPAFVAIRLIYNSPPTFQKLSAIKLTTFLSLFIAVLYIVQTMLISCETGLVAGLNGNYTQPECSSQCPCAAPYSEFEPVCVVDTMTTYMSPCHAGCQLQDNIGGLPVYLSCACAPTGGQRATVGACSVVPCRTALMMHKAVNWVIVLFTVVVLQAQQVTILRSVHPRDRPAAVGLTTALVLFATFTCGHLAYFGIRVWNCAWEEGGRCQFHTPKFLNAIGGTSCGLAATSAVISLVCCLVIRRRTPQDKEEVALARRSSNEIETHA